MVVRFIIILSIWGSLLSCKKNFAPDPSSDAFIETEPQLLVPVTKAVNVVIGGYYFSPPLHYEQSSKKYPLLIFIHGGGQFGDGDKDLPIVLSDGVPELIDAKLFPPSFTVNEKHYSFIVLIPQFKWSPSGYEIQDFINYAKRNYRIDSSRIYLSGLSYGGTLTCEAAAEYPSLFAAIVPIAGALNSGDISFKCQKLADGKVPIWIFHNDPDQFVNIGQSMNLVNSVNLFNPAIPPKFTILPAFGLYGHDAWTRATNPKYREDGMNIYEWMLQYYR